MNGNKFTSIQDGIECAAFRTAQVVGKRKGRERV
jgi:hypothetical protein